VVSIPAGAAEPAGATCPVRAAEERSASRLSAAGAGRPRSTVSVSMRPPPRSPQR